MKVKLHLGVRHLEWVLDEISTMSIENEIRNKSLVVGERAYLGGPSSSKQEEYCGFTITDAGKRVAFVHNSVVYRENGEFKSASFNPKIEEALCLSAPMDLMMDEANVFMKITAVKK